METTFGSRSKETAYHFLGLMETTCPNQCRANQAQSSKACPQDTHSLRSLHCNPIQMDMGWSNP